MGKKLSDMSLEELWQLFPIFLTEHRECWKDWYAEEKVFLEAFILQDIRIHHVGSTAVNSICAKPIVDILLEVPKECNLEVVKDLLVKHGYTCMSQSEGRISLNKGYTENGFAEKVFHVHVRHFGDNDELYFRDYLNEHSDIARAYEELKLTLWKKYEHDRDGYTDAKTEFIRKYTEEAKAKYGDRYQ